MTETRQWEKHPARRFGKDDVGRVVERQDYGQGYSEEKFGFRIWGRVWWVGIGGYGHDEEQTKEDREMCDEIVERLKEPALMDERMRYEIALDVLIRADMLGEASALWERVNPITT